MGGIGLFRGWHEGRRGVKRLRHAWPNLYLDQRGTNVDAVFSDGTVDERCEFCGWRQAGGLDYERGNLDVDQFRSDLGQANRAALRVDCIGFIGRWNQTCRSW